VLSLTQYDAKQARPGDRRGRILYYCFSDSNRRQRGSGSYLVHLSSCLPWKEHHPSRHEDHGSRSWLRDEEQGFKVRTHQRPSHPHSSSEETHPGSSRQAWRRPRFVRDSHAINIRPLNELRSSLPVDASKNVARPRTSRGVACEGDGKDEIRGTAARRGRMGQD